jgi:hypothetical protein
MITLELIGSQMEILSNFQMLDVNKHHFPIAKEDTNKSASSYGFTKNLCIANCSANQKKKKA